MIKRVLFTAALLVPVLAYGANPTANLSVQVVPVPVTSGGTCGSIIGQASADAAAAGFNTCALYNDFTTPIPNSIGTGLPSNWLDCSMDGYTPGSGTIWYWGVNGQGPGDACSGHEAVTTDPQTGGLALRLTLSSSDASNATSGMQTVNWTNTVPFPGPGAYPYGYYEWTFRNDTAGTLQAFWSWVTPQMITAAGLNPSNEQLIELDFLETQSAHADFGMNQWANAGVLGTKEIDLSGILPVTNYHTVGLLFTGDGQSAGNFAVCSYADGTRVGCTQWNYTVAGEELERHYIIAYLTTPPGSGSINTYIKQIKVLSCANWQQGGAAGMCHGSALNGSFYTP